MKTKKCLECNSDYFAEKSEMLDLCPNCSHYLYAYENCKHIFVNQSCKKCGWNGNTTNYIQKLMKND